MKHWEAGNGSLLLTLASPTTHSNFPSFSFSKQTVAAASLSLHAVVLHASGFIKHTKMHREQHHSWTCHSYRMEKRQASTTVRGGERDKVLRVLGVNLYLSRGTGSTVSCQRQVTEVSDAQCSREPCAELMLPAWHCGILDIFLALQTSLLPVHACEPFFSQASSVQVLRDVEFEKGKKKPQKMTFFLHLTFYTITILMVKADVMHLHRNTNAVHQHILTILHKNKTRGGR